MLAFLFPYKTHAVILDSFLRKVKRLPSFF